LPHRCIYGKITPVVNQYERRATSRNVPGTANRYEGAIDMTKHTTISDFPQHTIDRFWELVAIAGPDDCWPWLGGWDRKDSKYGRFYYGNFHIRAHRLAYILTYGYIPEGTEICHKCDNPPCCNPAHLFAGTHQQNMSDMVAKGRLVGLKGERSNSVKLTAQQVLEIRSMYETGKYSHLGLAHTFGVSEAAVQFIITRRTWKHI
jgi:hypothetical protein